MKVKDKVELTAGVKSKIGMNIFGIITSYNSKKGFYVDTNGHEDKYGKTTGWYQKDELKLDES